MYFIRFELYKVPQKYAFKEGTFFIRTNFNFAIPSSSSFSNWYVCVCVCVCVWAFFLSLFCLHLARALQTFIVYQILIKIMLSVFIFWIFHIIVCLAFLSHLIFTHTNTLTLTPSHMPTFRQCASFRRSFENSASKTGRALTNSWQFRGNESLVTIFKIFVRLAFNYLYDLVVYIQHLVASDAFGIVLQWQSGSYGSSISTRKCTAHNLCTATIQPFRFACNLGILMSLSFQCNSKQLQIYISDTLFLSHNCIQMQWNQLHRSIASHDFHHFSTYISV